MLLVIYPKARIIQCMWICAYRQMVILKDSFSHLISPVLTMLGYQHWNPIQSPHLQSPSCHLKSEQNIPFWFSQFSLKMQFSKSWEHMVMFPDFVIPWTHYHVLFPSVIKSALFLLLRWRILSIFICFYTIVFLHA